MANRYSKALKHIKKDYSLTEAPTNSLSGVYALNKPGTRLGPPPPDGRIFLPDIDGNYPPGIPGTPGEPFYKRGDGYWSGEVDWDTITTPNFGHSEVGTDGTNTNSLIDENTGVVLTSLPPNSRHFILGPLVDGYVYNHGSDAYTNIGYIQKDTRQFVLLARVNGQWVDNLSTFETYGWGIGRTWDGLQNSFYAYNPEFTYEMAQWYQKEVAENRFVRNVAYFYSGGVGQIGLGGSGPAPGMYGGTGVGAGGDGSEASGAEAGAGYGSGGEPNIGSAENEEPGDPEDAGFPWGWAIGSISAEDWAKIVEMLDAGMLLWDALAILGLIFPEPSTSAAGGLRLANRLRKLWKLYRSMSKGGGKDGSSTGSGSKPKPKPKPKPVDNADLPDYVNKADGPFTQDSSGAIRDRTGAEVVTPDGNPASPWQDSSQSSWGGTTGDGQGGYSTGGGSSKPSGGGSSTSGGGSSKPGGAGIDGIDLNDPSTWPSIHDNTSSGSSSSSTSSGSSSSSTRGGRGGKGGKGNNWNVDSNTGVVRDDSGKPTYQQNADGSYTPINDADVNRGRSAYPDGVDSRGSDLNPDGNYNYGTPRGRGGQGNTGGTTRRGGGTDGSSTGGGFIDGIKNWWNKGRDKGPTGPDGTENTASWGDLAANDWAQRGKPGDGSGGGWDPTRGFRPGVGADVGGFGSGPTPAVRQGFERPIRTIRDVGNRAGTSSGLPPKGALLNHNIDVGADVVLDRVIDQLKSPEDLNAMADKFENAANQIMQDSGIGMDQLVKGGILDQNMAQDMKPSTVKQFGSTQTPSGESPDAASAFMSINGQGLSPADFKAKFGVDPGEWLSSQGMSAPLPFNHPQQAVKGPGGSPGQEWDDPNKGKKFVPPPGKGPVKTASGEGGSPGQPYVPPKENPNNPWVPAPGKGTKVAATYGKGSKKSDWFSDFQRQVKDFEQNPAQDPFSRKGTGMGDRWKGSQSPFPDQVLPGLGAKDGDKVAWGGGKSNVPTSQADFGAIKRRTATTDATMSVNGMGMSPAQFQKKYKISPDQWLRLPQQQSKKKNKNTVLAAHYKKVENELLCEDKLKILKEIKKPLTVNSELPKKMSGYKPNFKGKYTPQNTPDVTACPESDKLQGRANARGQTWRTENKYWQGYETTERMNILQDRLGHGNQAWDMIIDEARNKNGWKNREIQEQLNIIAHTKAMKDINPDYEDPFTYLQLQEMGNVEPSTDLIGDEKRKTELDTYLKDPLVKRVAKKVKSTLDYKDKPAKKGYPDEPPKPQVNGWHPEFGKKSAYYKKLDPVSALAMPKQDDPEIDAEVEKQKIDAVNKKYGQWVDPKVGKKKRSNWQEELNYPLTNESRWALEKE